MSTLNARLSHFIPYLIAIGMLFFASTALADDTHPRLRDIRISHTFDQARMTLEFDKDTAYRFFTLSKPNRIVIDVQDLIWEADRHPLPEHAGLISNLRYGLYQPHLLRIVFDLTHAIKIEKYSELPGRGDNLNGRRLYIDLSAAKTYTPQRFHSNSWPAYKLENRQVSNTKDATPSVRQNKIKHNRKIVVIDPGHGGVDPGSIAEKNIYEKKIVLHFAQICKSVLESTGRYKVILTRSSDIYVPLRKRFQFAENQQASIFISLHADRLDDPSVRGSSIYTLSDQASDAESEKLAAQENRSDILTGHILDTYSQDVSSILIDLAQESTNRQSWRLAQTILKSFPKSIRTVNRPHRHAGFAVLKSPNVPSVLVELGFLSNGSDVKLLIGKDYPKQFADSLLRALDVYFKVS